MIEMKQTGEEATIFLSGKPLDIIDQGDDFIIAGRDFDDLPDKAVQKLPENLVINIHHETGFGTFFSKEDVTPINRTSALKGPQTGL